MASLFDRVLGRQKAVPDRNPSDAPRQPEVFYLNSGIAAAVVQWDANIAAKAAMSHPVIYRAVNKIAETVQTIPWKIIEDPDVARADAATALATKQKRLQEVLRSPNDEMSGASFRYWMALNYALYGRVPYKVGVSAIDQTLANGLYPLETRYVYAKLNDRGAAVKYEYGQELESKRNSLPSARAFQARPNSNGFIDQIWKPGLKGYQDRQDANSALPAVGLPAEVIKLLLKRAIQTAEGRPNIRYIITTDRNISEDQLKSLKNVLSEEALVDGSISGQTPVLRNVGEFKIHEMRDDFADIHSKTPSDDMARIIFGAFGIPIALGGLGAADAAKFAGNFQESRAAFYQDTIIPGYVNPLFSGLSRVICPPGLKIEPDYEKVPAMVHARMQAMKQADNINFLTTSEKRKMFDLPEESVIPEVIINTRSGSAAAQQPSGETDE